MLIWDTESADGCSQRGTHDAGTVQGTVSPHIVFNTTFNLFPPLYSIAPPALPFPSLPFPLSPPAHH
jgi:hypothetical protein